MKHKFYFFISLLIFSNIFAQKQNINYGSINFEISSQYKILDKNILDDVLKTVRNENKMLDETYKQIELDYNERIIFSFKNLLCNCLNNLVLSQTKNGFSFSNNDYSLDTELQLEIKRIYDESIEGNKEKINNSNVAKILKINPATFNKTKNINYFHISTEMLMLNKNNTIVADIITIPVENFFYQLEFSTDKKNYDTIQPLIKEIIQSLKINK
ncbi:hypothetical protein QGN23_03720 [Chryseobacterium gotjawalense]|uniref:Uncharacterized protein n=1 Tax=Chryseobacterium gotjawalense TaxID=3042315 RepID=A0ABY8RFU6_9FLAO|nr:hypothetical protein [Chryseobacterium sp. wdc7]WHF52394.1 hypothetical protein QGN23_03720 [Chryseobacterium sp. wdc7]